MKHRSTQRLDTGEVVYGNHTADPSPRFLLRMCLRRSGFAHMVDDLPHDVPEKVIVRRLLEMGPGLDEKGNKPAPTLAEFQMLVQASQCVSPEAAEHLLRRVRDAQNDESDPALREIAMRALVLIDINARRWIARLDERRNEELRNTFKGKIRGCCAGHDG